MPLKAYIVFCTGLTVMLSFMIASLAPKPVPTGFQYMGIVLSVMVPLAFIFMLGWTEKEDRLVKFMRDAPLFKKIFLLVVNPLISYAFYLSAGAWETISLMGILLWCGFVILPAGIFIYTNRLPQRWTWYDILVFLLLFIPFDHRLLNMIWGTPQGLEYVYTSLFLVTQGYLGFAVFRGVQGIGFSYISTGNDFKIGLKLWGGLALILIPLGLSLGFLKLNFPERIPWELPLSFIGLFLGVALPEELFFRGIVQNLFQKTLHNDQIAILVTSILFGLVHFNNGGDWRFVLLASIAGIFYGTAYLKTGSLMTPIWLHAITDTVWKYFFHL